jgi:hypothetical protein
VNPFFANFKTLKVTGHSPATEVGQNSNKESYLFKIHFVQFSLNL